MESAESRSDWELLQDYLLTGSEAAFSALVARHLGLVYSVAYRYCADRGLAEEVANSVFLTLSRKAQTLKHEVAVAGWLFKAARNVAANAHAFEGRRKRWVQEASDLNTSPLSPGDATNAWEIVSDELDRALAALNQGERDLILLRFYEDKSFREMGTTFEISEEAAGKRTARAMEKLRQILFRRGVTWPASTLALAVASYSRHGASPEMVNGIARSVVNARASDAPSPPRIYVEMLRRLLRNRSVAVTAIGSILIFSAIWWAGGKSSTPLEPRDVFYLQSGTVLRGDGESYVKTLFFRGPAELEMRPLLSESVRLKSTLRSALVQRFGANEFSRSQFPRLLDLFDTNEIAHATQMTTAGQTVLVLPWGSRLPFIRESGQWKLDFFRLPGMPAPETYAAMTKRRSLAIQAFSADLKSGVHTNIREACDALESRLK